MKALSVNVYWAWAIRSGHKRVENRERRTSHRGPLLIHAVKNTAYDLDALGKLRAAGIEPPVLEVVEPWRGCIVARCTVVDCREYLPLLDDDLASDPLAWGRYCWMLADAVGVEPAAARARPGLFDVEWHD